MDGDHGKMELEEGMVWAIPKDAVHSFHTAESNEELNVIAFHPDSDWGPLDEDHPMLNRTWVDGAKIDNCTESHRRADMLLTDQSRALHIASSLKKALGPELQPPEPGPHLGAESLAAPRGDALWAGGFGRRLRLWSSAGVHAVSLFRRSRRWLSRKLGCAFSASRRWPAPSRADRGTCVLAARPCFRP